MLDHFKSLSLFAMAELNYLRMEAMDLFERCLTEGSPDFLTAFIEKQITHDPPRLELLHEIAEDLHQRLLSLREYHFDVRDRVVRMLRTDFHIDLNHFAPVSALENYHHIEIDQLLGFVNSHNPRLTTHDLAMLRQVLDASMEMAAQLHDDVSMTNFLFAYVMDWADGLSVAEMRRSWLNEWEQNRVSVIH
ncbi:MAG: hypothetical protein K8L97_10910 [Anaerolineae bacterium]|nr:hypothetical protein [Anaerolineae bacterium]